MKIRNNVPMAYDENYPLDFKEQTIIIEMSFINYKFLDQLRMPMVIEMEGASELTACFQRCVASIVLTFVREGLLTVEFYETNKDILDEEHGIRPDITLDTMGIYDLSYDLHYMMCRYMIVLGHEHTLIPKQDDYCNDKRFFTPRKGF